MWLGEITEPAMTDKDLLIVGSGSGETAFPLIIAKKAKELNATVAHIGANPNSSMSHIRRRVCPSSYKFKPRIIRRSAISTTNEELIRTKFTFVRRRNRIDDCQKKRILN